LRLLPFTDASSFFIAIRVFFAGLLIDIGCRQLRRRLRHYRQIFINIILPPHYADISLSFRHAARRDLGIAARPRASRCTFSQSRFRPFTPPLAASRIFSRENTSSFSRT